MAKLTQQERKTIFAFMAALFTVLTDDQLAELSGLSLRPFMTRKAKAIEMIKQILEEIK